MARNDTGKPKPRSRSGHKSDATPGRSRSPKPGSSAEAAKAIGGKGDFGVPADASHSREREYVSRNTKVSDPGASMPADYEEDGVRDHGVGKPNSGPGSASGGDLDTDIIGVGTGGSGVATSGAIHQRPGPDDVGGARDAGDNSGASGKFASGAPAAKGKETGVGHVGGSKRVAGSIVFSELDASPTAQGADSATNPSASDDDSFAGEVSSGEARGEDEDSTG